MSWWFVFRRRLWIIRNDDNAAVTPSVVELMAFSSAPSTFPVYRLIGTPACRLPWWNARERCDKALMVPNLYVETTCQLHCLLDSLFVVAALHNFGAPQKVTTASDGVDAI